MKLSRLWDLIVQASRYWSADNASTLGAALAFYCAFSLAPLLVLLVTTVGWITGADTAYGYLSQQLTSLFGSSTSDILINAARASQETNGAIGTAISIVSLLVGATTVFSALESSLELIWGSQTMVPEGIRGFVRSRLLSFGLIIAVGFLLLVSLALSTALTVLKARVFHPYQSLTGVAAVLDLVGTVSLTAMLFAIAFRYLPARRIEWKLALTGAFFTAMLFQLGRWLIGIYLGRSNQPSAFGAAASFVALLLWLYYSAQIFLFGAEFTSCLAGFRKEKTIASRQGDRKRSLRIVHSNDKHVSN
jgi:membrane protein